MKNVINKCKQYKGVLVIVLMGLSFLAYYFSVQESTTNIFDEIYRNEISYLQGGGSIELMNIKGFDIYTRPDTSAYREGTVSASYKNESLPDNSLIQVSSNEETMRILYHETLDDNVKLFLTEDYSPKNKVLKRNVYVKDNYERYYNEQLADYLTRYQLTKQSILDKFALVDNTFLADWVKVSDSSYSPSNYGDVKVVDEWKIEE